MGLDAVPPPSLRDRGVTPREADVFWLVGDRLRNHEIAERLHLSERTVESHVSSLLRKLGGSTRATLVEAAAGLRADGERGSLPKPLSSFVGREHEAADVAALVAAHRLVTLTGPAGAGKTRLALHVGESVDGMPPAVLVDLATLAPSGDVERVFADALGVAGDERRVRGHLRESLVQRPNWLVVDNCEHVVDDVAELLADLLATTHGLRVLATSLRPLHIAGEVVYDVGPLSLPPEDASATGVLGTPAGRLFADRAAAALPGFTVTEANALDVAGVCRRLDGLPLAIELAAARVRAFSPAEILAQLRHHLDPETGDGLAPLGEAPRGPASRHRTLEAALAWSYGLLADDEQLLLERCSVFRGDVDFDTVVEVLAYPPLRRTDFASLFPRLLDRSMITTRRDGQVTQYRLLDSVRHFAAARLAQRGESDTVRERHAVHHLRGAAARLPDLQGRDQERALAWFARRWPDLRVAAAWALDHGGHDLVWEFLGGIGTGWEILGASGELFDWLDVLLERQLPDGSMGVRAASTAGLLLCYQDSARARGWAQAAYDLSRHTGEERDEALALLALGMAAMYLGDSQEAVDELTRARACLERLDDTWHQGFAAQLLGMAEPDVAVGLAHLRDAVSLFDRAGDLVKQANCLIHAAGRSIDARTHLDEAGPWLEEARELVGRTGNLHEGLHTQLCRARLEQCRGEHERAAERFERLLPDFRRIGDRRCVSRCLLGLGHAALRAGDPAARRHLEECISVARGTGDARELAAALRLLAQDRLVGGDPAYAASLLLESDEVAARLDPPRRSALPDDPDVRTRLAAQDLRPDAGRSRSG